MNRPSLPWLADLPDRWAASRLRFVSKLNPSKQEVRTRPPDEAVSFVPMDAVGEWGGLRLDDSKSIGEVQAGFTYFRDGDVVVAKVTPCFENGKGAIASGLVGGIAFGTTELHVLRAGAKLDPTFLFYLTLSHPFRQVGASEMYGAGGQKRVPEWFFRDFVAPVPPVPAQRSVAAFLDRKTAAIDQLIQKKERLIELLGAKRQALITQAVTKGLDPGVPMKDSGIAWFGAIPNHWTVTQPKRFCSQIVDGPHQTPSYVEQGVPFVTVKNLTMGPGISFEETNFITSGDHRTFTRRARPQRGDVLLTKDGATLGVPRVVETDREFSIFVSVALLKILPGAFDPHFLEYALQADSTWQQFKLAEAGSAIKHIVLSTIANVWLARPPVSEQRDIAVALLSAIERSDELTSNVSRQAGLLREYRQALISAAVTGQIDVGNEAA